MNQATVILAQLSFLGVMEELNLCSFSEAKWKNPQPHEHRPAF